MSNGMSIPHKKDDKGALFLPSKPQDGYDRASSYQRESQRGAVRHGSLPLLEDYQCARSLRCRGFPELLTFKTEDCSF